MKKKWDILVECLKEENFRINKLREEMSKEDFKAYSQRIKRFYTNNIYCNAAYQNNFNPRLVSCDSIAKLRLNEIKPVVKDSMGIVIFSYPSEINGGRIVERPFVYGGVFTEGEPKPEKQRIKLSELENWGIIVGSVASEEVLEMPKYLSDIAKNRNSQILGELVKMKLIKN